MNSNVVNSESNNKLPGVTPVYEYGQQGTVRILMGKLTGSMMETFSELQKSQAEMNQLIAQTTVDAAKEKVNASRTDLAAAGLGLGLDLGGAVFGSVYLNRSESSALEKPLNDKAAAEAESGAGIVDSNATDEEAMTSGDRTKTAAERQADIDKAKYEIKDIQQSKKTRSALMPSLVNGVSQFMSAGLKVSSTSEEAASSIDSATANATSSMKSEMNTLGNTITSFLDEARRVNPVVVSGAIRG